MTNRAGGGRDNAKIKELSENQDRIMGNQKRIEAQLRLLKIDDVKKKLGELESGQGRNGAIQYLEEAIQKLQEHMIEVRQSVKEEIKTSSQGRERIHKDVDFHRLTLKKLSDGEEETKKAIEDIRTQLTNIRRRAADKNSYRSKLEDQANSGAGGDGENQDIEEDIV